MARTPPVLRNAREVRVLERVARPIDAGRLSVPHAENSVEARAGKEAGNLASEDRGRSQVFVHSGKEANFVLFENFRCARLESEIESAQG